MRAGAGTLDFAHDGTSTVVSRARADAPVKFLFPRTEGGARHVVVTTLGGGLVEGDAIDLDVSVADGARAVLATQASTKVYRSTTAGARQTLRASVGAGALLCLLPDPVVPFRGARYAQSTHVQLAQGASVVTLDVVASGRVAHGERWAFERFASQTRLGDAVRDAMLLDASEIDVARTMGRFDAFATLFALGPLARIAPEDVPLSRRGSLVASASPVGTGTCVRVAAERLDDLLAYVRHTVAPLREALGGEPQLRRW